MVINGITEIDNPENPQLIINDNNHLYDNNNLDYENNQHINL